VARIVIPLLVIMFETAVNVSLLILGQVSQIFSTQRKWNEVKRLEKNPGLYDVLSKR